MLSPGLLADSDSCTHRRQTRREPLHGGQRKGSPFRDRGSGKHRQPLCHHALAKEKALDGIALSLFRFDNFVAGRLQATHRKNRFRLE